MSASADGSWVGGVVGFSRMCSGFTKGPLVGIAALADPATDVPSVTWEDTTLPVSSLVGGMVDIGRCVT